MKKAIIIVLLLSGLACLASAMLIVPFVNTSIFSNEENILNRLEASGELRERCCFGFIAIFCAINFIIYGINFKLENITIASSFIIILMCVVELVVIKSENKAIYKRRNELTSSEINAINELVNDPGFRTGNLSIAENLSPAMRFDSWGHPYLFTRVGEKIVIATSPSR